ncbi:MAG: hypothetical protein IKA52_04610 [Bacteroidaceae bacterium]|nr:hypothetical protein [Bacteroidaceae bacterium]
MRHNSRKRKLSEFEITRSRALHVTLLLYGTNPGGFVFPPPGGLLFPPEGPNDGGLFGCGRICGGIIGGRGGNGSGL